MTTEPTSDSLPAQGPRFADLGLPEPLMRALADVGYEVPSPIQAATIPPLLLGRDVLGQAQTGTGKTAAFALPVLARIDPRQHKPQALVLAPTRELAIQVAEAFQKYAKHLPGFHVLPIYGGQGYAPQLSALKRGVQVIVGTPGRVIDHLTRGSLDLSELRCLVLDEADEMLRMGFIDDVETVLKKTPPERQVALFSATMPQQIRRIAQTYLKDPVEVAIKSTTSTAANIRQRYWMVSGVNKLDALTRILEAETYDGMLVFARTKLGAQELAERLAARGLSAAAIHGDVEQKQREKMIQSLKDGRIDILVATDVAARGLDVDRISHVLNYDIPYDTESYVHRIGRTGRAGRSGEAILFVAPRERGMLGAIERATRQKIEPMQLPSVDAVNDQRVARFLGRITGAAEAADLATYRDLVERYEREHNVPMVEIAAALAKLAQGDTPLLLPAVPERQQYERPQYARNEHGRNEHGRNDSPRPRRDDGYAPSSQAGANASSSHTHATPATPHGAAARSDRGGQPQHTPRPPRDDAPRHAARQFTPPTFAAPQADDGHDAQRGGGTPTAHDAPTDTFAPTPSADAPAHDPSFTRAPKSHHAPERGPRATGPRETDIGMETFRIEVGHNHGVQPGNIVGAIANEADLESRYIGRIDIRDEYSLVDLPEGMPKELLEHLKKVYVGGQPLRMRPAEPADSAGAGSAGRGKRTFAPKPGADRARRPGPPRPAGPRGPRGPR